MKFSSVCLLSGLSLLSAMALAASPFDGMWNSSCYSQTAQGQTQYGLDKMVINDTTMTVDSTIYTDATCQSQGIATVHTGAALALNTDSSAPTGAEDADLTLTTLTLTFHDAQYIGYLNSEQFCGYSDWALEQPQDVMGKDCGGQTMPSDNTVTYDLMGIGADGKLYMGLMTQD